MTYFVFLQKNRENMTKANALVSRMSFDVVDDNSIMYLINEVRKGIDYHIFTSVIKNLPLSISEWSGILHVSERTMQRYKKEKRAFDTLQSEKIIQVTMLFRYGADVFGSYEKLHRWLETESLSLGKVRPKELLDSSFGIDLLKDELTRIEHGILA